MEKEPDNKEKRLRNIDKLAKRVNSWWADSLVVVTKTRVKTWKGALLLTFVSGLVVATVWGVTANIFQGSLAGMSTSFLLDPPTDTVQVGETFDLDAVINTDNENVVALKAIINYDKDKFELQAVDTSNSVFAVDNTCQYEGKACEIIERDDSSGKVTITLSKPSPGINSQSGIIATLTFKALKATSPGSDNFTFSYSSLGNYTDSDMIADDGNGTDTLDTVVNARITVASPPPPTCTDFNYSSWGSCQSNSIQSRTATTSFPDGCSGGSPVLTQACVYSGSPVSETCTDFTYSDWSACSVDGDQSRSLTGSSPEGCTGGDSELERECSPPETEEDETEEGEPEIVDDDRPIKIEGEKQKFGKSDNFYADSKSISLQGGDSDIINGKVKIYVNGDLKKETDANENGDWKVNVKVSKDGNYDFKVRYFDSNENQTAESTKYVVKVDTSDPEFTDLPRLLNKKRGDKIWWKAEDNRKIDHFKVEFLGKIKNTTRSSFNVPADAPRGVHIIKVRAYDKIGNTASRMVTILVR